MLLDLSNARVVINYDYNYYNANGTDDVTDDIIERKRKHHQFLLGVFQLIYMIIQVMVTK